MRATESQWVCRVISAFKFIACLFFVLIVSLASAGISRPHFDAAGAAAAQTEQNNRTDCSDCIADSDHDGVADPSDQCADTEPGAPVTMRGCPHDSDGDGLHDHWDRCANTKSSARIDANGCAVGAQIALPEVAFRKNSTTLTRRATRALDDLIATLNMHADLRIEIAGYTDSRGRADKNLSLSQRRADAVRGYLLGAGVASSRVGARGYGAADPIADNDTDWGRARNRRVVVRVLNP